jgi:hypothetical protein
MTTPETIKGLYSFPGFEALLRLRKVPEDPGARVITLRRRQKKIFAPVAGIPRAVFTTAKFIVSGIFPEPAFAYGLNSNTDGLNATGARP